MLGRRYAGRRNFARSLARFYNEKPPVTAAGMGWTFFVFIGIARKVSPEVVDRKEKAKRSVNWLALQTC